MSSSSSTKPAQFPASKLSWRKRSIDPTSLHPFDPSTLALLSGLLSASRELDLCQKPRFCQRLNARTICRRASSLSPLFEEIGNSGAGAIWVPPSAIISFRLLRTAFRNIKALIHDCRHTSTLLLLMEQGLLASQFQNLNAAIADALANLPIDLLEISQETRELVALMQKHASRAEAVVDPEERQLQAEVLLVLAALEAGTSPDEEKLRHICKTVYLNDASDCERELWMLENQKEKLKREEQYTEIPNVNSLVSLMRYARCMLYGLGPDQQVAAACRKYVLSCASMKKVVLARVEETEEGGGVLVPEDFKCPISLEIMVDPVVIASGQSYERASISRWLEDGHVTCPKSGSPLLHKNLVPNCSLRHLIAQWCAENDYVLEGVAAGSKKVPSSVTELPNTKAAMEATKLTAEFLVGKLSTASVHVQRQAAYEIRLMAKEGNDNRDCVATAGAVPALAALLDSQDRATQENAVTALLNLSINERNKELLVRAPGALDGILRVLAAKSGATSAARENAAATLFCISATREYRSAVGARAEAIDGLLTVLREGSTRGKRDAAATLFNLGLNAEIAGELLKKGAVMAAIEALEGKAGEEVAEEVAGLLAVLGRGEEGLVAVRGGIGRVVAVLIDLVSDGSGRCKEYITALLLAACCDMSEAGCSGAAALRRRLRSAPTLVPALQRLRVGGTPRAQRKAASLLRLLHS